MNINLLRSAIDSANIEDCFLLHYNRTAAVTSDYFGALHATTLESTTLVDPCHSSPCIHGVCQVTSPTEYSCTCEYGYVGRNCENVLKQCELLKPCINGGTCNDLHGTYKCDCRLGYNGKNCEKCNSSLAIF